MKKLLLLLAGLLFAVLPSAAQQKVADITDRVVTKAADLTSGYYILNCYYLKQSGDDYTKPNGSVVYSNASNNRDIQSDAAGFINERKTQLNDNQANYIWFVKKANDGTYTIRNIQTNVYFPLDSETGDNMVNPETKEAAVYTLRDKEDTDILNRTYSGIVLQTTADNSESWSVFANYGGSGNPTLSYWTAGGGGEVLFQFVEVKNIDFNIVYPFHTSAAPSNGVFNEETKWQFLTIKNKYLYYTDENTKIKVTADYSIEDRYLWAFHMNEDGKIVIYNKLAGADKVLAAGEMSGTEGGGTFPNFVPANEIPQNQIAVWDGTKSFSISGKDGFFLYRGNNKTERMNLRTADNTEVLSFWTAGANDGSTFWVLPYVNYTIKYVNGEGEELQEPTVGYGVAGTSISIPETLDNLVPKSARDNNGNELAIENNSITLPESYDCVITVNYKDNFQFETTRIIDGSFASDTKWYYLKLNNRYLSFNDVLEEYNYTSGATTETQTFVYSYSLNPLNYGCFWAFVKDGDDLKIYNAATGTSMVLASKGSTERVFYPTMMTPNTEGYTDCWHYKVAKDPTKFYLYLQGTTNNDELYADNANKLNCYGITGANPNNYLTFSTGDGDWSYFTVEPVDITTTIATVRENQEAPTGAVGTLVSESYESFTAALNKGTAEGLAEALKIRDLTGTTIPFDPSKYYRIENVTRKHSTGNTENVGNGGYLEYADKKEDTAFTQTFYAYDKGADRAGAIWKFEVAEGTEGTYKLQSLNSKKYIKSNGSGNSTTAVDTQEEATGFKFAKLAATVQFNIVTTDNATNRLHVTGDNNSNGGNVITYNSGGANTSSAWYIIPATTIDVNISSANYTTVNYPFAVELPEDQDITAYFATIIDGNKNNLMLRKVYSGHIPANTPVVLQGAPNTYTLNIVSEDQPTNISNNILEGTLLSETMGAGDIFVLSKPENKNVGFYLLNDAENANRTIPANKAYLPGSNLPVTSQGVRGFTFSFEDSDGETTDIENEIVDLSQEEFYDLQGRRVQNPTKGIYVTKSGKKILFVK